MTCLTHKGSQHGQWCGHGDVSLYSQYSNYDACLRNFSQAAQQTRRVTRAPWARALNAQWKRRQPKMCQDRQEPNYGMSRYWHLENNSMLYVIKWQQLAMHTDNGATICYSFVRREKQMHRYNWVLVTSTWIKTRLRYEASLRQSRQTFFLPVATTTRHICMFFCGGVGQGGSVV